MKCQAIIFDMDGTIVDTDLIWNQVTRTLIERRGVLFTPELEQQLHERIKGLAMHKSCQVIKDLTAITDPLEDLIKEKSALAISMYKTGITFIPGFVEFHKKLQEKQLKLGLATNADDATLQTTTQAVKLDNFFGEHLYNISCVGNVCKPDPAIYTHVAKQLAVAPEACIAIEDSFHGVMAAKRAGMRCIGINTGKDRDALRYADVIVEGYADIDLESLL